MHGPLIVGRFASLVQPKLDEHGDPLDRPKSSKFEVNYVYPPEGTAIQCATCMHFREPDECEIVGNKGAIIYPEGCCDAWEMEEAHFSTPEDPNPNESSEASNRFDADISEEEDE